MKAKNRLMDVEFVVFSLKELVNLSRTAKEIDGNITINEDTTIAEWEDNEASVIRFKKDKVKGKCSCSEFAEHKECNHIGLHWANVRELFADLVEIEEIEKEIDVKEKVEQKLKAKVKAAVSKNLYDVFMQLLEGEPDLIEIFGETGSGKSVIALKLLEDARDKGLRTLFIDTEGNLRPSQRPDNYHYLASFEDLKKFIFNLEDGYNVIILDSIGIPVLGAYAAAKLHQKGQMLLDMQAIAYMLKKYALKNKCLVLITNQPVSELSAMAIEDEVERERAIRDRRPFGDKMSFFIKEVLRTKLVDSSEKVTVANVEAYRSRKFGRGKKLFSIKIDEEGVMVT
jgi:predicted alpha/beta-fold hydrolase